MRSIILTAALLFIAGGWSAAQEDERPDLSLPEPQKTEEKRPAFAVPEPAKDLADLGSFTVTSVVYDQSQENIDRQSTALPELGKYFQSHTRERIDTKVRFEERRLADKNMARSNMLFLTGSVTVLHFSDYEKKFLGDYLRGGGFLFAEDIQGSNERGGGGGVEGTPFDRQFKALMADPAVLGSQGRYWQRVENDHPLYKSYFDFPTGPPLARVQGGNISYLETLEVRGRTAVVFSDLCISRGWGDPFASSRERDLQFGTNLVVFAIAERAAGTRMIKGR
jgi:hypothetical protein